MIEIRLNDNVFEQDIRELLMAFYPGEEFIYSEPEGVEEKEADGAEAFLAEPKKVPVPLHHMGRMPQKQERPVLFALEGIWNAERTLFDLHLVHYGTSEFHILQDLPPELSEELDRCEEPVQADPENRSETKNRIKRRLYVLLMSQTGKRLPWGALTGIRPTKIAMTHLTEGMEPAAVQEMMEKQYYASKEKAALSVEIAQRERELLAQIDCDHGYSLYIGIPFCPTTCAYCSFTSYPIDRWAKKTAVYLDALFKELDFVAEQMKGRTLDTVYFGGGTPTSLSPEDLDRLITKLRLTFDVDHAREFTVEAGRPDSITREKLRVLKKHGVTRISINPQTMKQETLDLIGRRHTVEDVKEKFAMAREEGFDNINMDLIIGLPEEELEDVRNTMEEIKKLCPDSLTIHSLAIKRAARLHTMKEVYQDFKIVNTHEMIDLTAEYARKMGLEPYYLYRQKNMAGNFENVGYAAPGKACLYNVLIMEEQQTIVGCGAGTTTKMVIPDENRIERTETVKNVEQYVERVDEMIERKRQLFQNQL